MRTSILITILTFAVSIVAMPMAQAQDQSPLIGAWELTEATDADGNVIEATGMIIFSAGHYSWIRVDSSDRPDYSSQDEATDVQKLAAFESFSSNAGSYTVSGSTLTRDPVAAKNPYVYAPDFRIVQDFEIDGRTLTITGTRGVRIYSRLD